jgi:hypothetical protein
VRVRASKSVGAVVSLIERSTENLIWLSTIIALEKVTNVLKNFIEFSPPV